jgi:hypothetical protein
LTGRGSAGIVRQQIVRKFQMNGRLALIAALPLIGGIALAQELPRFDREYGGNAPQATTAIVATEDGGALIVGRAEDPNTSWDALALRIAADGTPLRAEVNGGPGMEIVRDVVALDNGTLLMLVDGRGKGDRPAGYLGRLLTDGRFVLSRAFQGEVERRDRSLAYLYGITPTADGGVLMVGSTQRNPKADLETYLVSVEASGDPRWERRFDAAATGRPSTVHELADGRFAVIGASAEGDWRTERLAFMTFSAEGDFIARTLQPATGNRLTIRASAHLPGAGFAVLIREADERYSTITPSRIVFFSEDGEKVWERDLPEDVFPFGLDPVDEGRFAVLGSGQEREGDATDNYVALFDGQGTVLTEERFGQPGTDEYLAAAATRADGSIIVAGARERSVTAVTLEADGSLPPRQD